MPRPPRIIDPEGTYHIFNRGNNRSETFRNPRDFAKFLEILSLNKAKYGFSLFHFCLMPNHFHLVLRPESDAMPDFMHGIKNAFSKYFCLKYGFVGHVWQGRYQAKPITTDEYLFACGNYVEMNPVRAKLVQRPEVWPYSSYRHYAFGERDPLIDTDPFYPSIGRTDDERRFQYQRLIDKTRAGAWHQNGERVPGTS